MRHATIITFCILGSYTVNAQAPNWLWAKAIGGLDNNACTTDVTGNVYTTGTFLDTVDFDPSPAVVNLISNGNDDVFITKSDASGNFAWAKSIGGTDVDQGKGVAVDNDGFVYVTGKFFGTVDFDPGPGVFNITSTGNYDVYLLKLDPNGNLVWAKSIGGYSIDEVTSLVIDRNINCLYICGYFDQSIDLDPGAGQVYIPSIGQYDGFTVKTDTGGNYIWGYGVGSTGSEFCYGASLDASGNLLQTGMFAGSNAQFGFFTLSSIGNRDIWISKTDRDGHILWAKNMGGVNAFAQGNAITSDPNDNVIITGKVQRNIDFDPGPGEYFLAESAGSEQGDIFICKTDSGGNFLWVGRMGGIDNNYGTSVITDQGSNVYVTGYMLENADYDPDTTVSLMLDLTGIFITKLNPAGVFEWVKSPTTNDDGRGFGLSLCKNSTDNILLAGDIYDGLYFDSLNVTSLGFTGIFVAKLSSIVGIEEPNNVIAGFELCPSPLTGNQIFLRNISTGKNSLMQVYDINSKVIFSADVKSNSFSLDVSGYRPGIYFISLSGNTGMQVQRFIIE